MKKTNKKVVVMDIIIVILILLNASLIIAITENSDNINVGNKTYFLMKLYNEDEYGKAVDYAEKYSQKVNTGNKTGDKSFTDDFNECVAVADYYKAEFYKNIYMTAGDNQRVQRMIQDSQDAQKRMGEMSPIKVKIDRMLEKYMVTDN